MYEELTPPASRSEAGIRTKKTDFQCSWNLLAQSRLKRKYVCGSDGHNLKL